MNGKHLETNNKKSILITGFSGFVARNFLEFLVKEKMDIRVWGIDIKEPEYSLGQYREYLELNFQKLDLLNVEELKTFLQEIHPEYILHLASFSSVSYSWTNPGISFVNNTNIFLNLALSIKDIGLKTRLLSVGSSEEYGKYDEDEMPLKEDYPLHPCSPYAVARVSQELLAAVFVESYGMDIILTRSFNHIGPWQDSRFVVPSFIEKVIDLKKSGVKSGAIEVGDLSIIRDFVDVRDVVKAYWLLLQKGKSGEVYNICSGSGIRLKEVLELIGKISGVRVEGKCTKKYIRPDENRIVIGSNVKICKELAWKPLIKLEDTLQDMIQYM